MINRQRSLIAVLAILLGTRLATASGPPGSGTGTAAPPPGSSPMGGGTPTGTGSPSGAQPPAGSPQSQGGNNAPTQSSPVSPPSVFFESQSLAYGGVDNIAAAIGTRICSSIPDGSTRRIFIYDSATFGNVALVSGFLMQLRLTTAALQAFVDIPPGTVPDAGLAKQIQDLQERVAKLEAQVSELERRGAPPPPGKLGVGLATAESVLQALGPYISASTTDKNTNFNLSDAAIAMNVTHYLTGTCRAKVQVIYPRIGLPIDTVVGGHSANQMLQNLLMTLFMIQRQASALVQAGEDKYLPSPSTSEQTTPGPTPSTTKSITPATQIQIPKTFAGLDYQSFSGANGLLNQILAYYTQPLPGGTAPAIASVAQGYQLLQELAKPDSNVLFMEGTAAGGTQRIRKNLITNLFTGDWIRYSGGAIVAYGVLDLASGEMFPTDTHRFITPYTTIRKADKQGTKAARAGDNLGR
jgi:hypothetical protein